MSLPSKNKFDAQLPVASPAAPPTPNFRDYMVKLDALVTAIAAGNLPGLVNAASDAAAAKLGVAVGQMYRNGSAVQVRVV